MPYRDMSEHSSRILRLLIGAQSVHAAYAVEFNTGFQFISRLGEANGETLSAPRITALA